MAETQTEKGPRKSYGMHLVGPTGSDVARVLAIRKSDGTARSRVLIQKKNAEGKLKTDQTGATGNHTTMEAAISACEKHVAKLQTLGWQLRKTGGRSFAAKPDAFDANSLPAPKRK